MLKSLPARLAQYVSSQLEIPTIGIGAGVGCDGQVLVTHDLLGLFDRFTPKFVKRYAELHQEMSQAFNTYKQEVETRSFPSAEHSVEMPEGEWRKFMEVVNNEL